MFIKFTTNTVDGAITTKDSRIVEIYNNYDSNMDGFLSKDDFLRFYRERAEIKPETVWSNLAHRGYTNDLK